MSSCTSARLQKRSRRKLILKDVSYKFSCTNNWKLTFTLRNQAHISILGLHYHFWWNTLDGARLVDFVVNGNQVSSDLDVTTSFGFNFPLKIPICSQNTSNILQNKIEITIRNEHLSDSIKNELMGGQKRNHTSTGINTTSFILEFELFIVYTQTATNNLARISYSACSIEISLDRICRFSSSVGFDSCDVDYWLWWLAHQ